MFSQFKKIINSLKQNKHDDKLEDSVPSVGNVDFGSFRRLKPISSGWGFDRGTPIDRYYIGKFLNKNKNNIKGRVLEIGENYYTKKYGDDRVLKSEIFHIDENNPDATIVGDISNAEHVNAELFDCVIFTQTLQLIYDFKNAIYHIHRILKKDGVLLATFPGITQTYDQEWGNYWCWSFTPLSAKKIFSEFFSERNLDIENFGNVLSATSFLQGLSMEELSNEELDFNDKGYVVTIAVRAIK